MVNPMLRLVVRLAGVLWLTLGVSAAALWVRSEMISDILDYERPTTDGVRREVWHLQSFSGSVTFIFTRTTILPSRDDPVKPRPETRTWRWITRGADEYYRGVSAEPRSWAEYIPEVGSDESARPGGAHSAGWRTWTFALYLPDWILIVPAIVVTVWQTVIAGRRRHRRQLAAAGRCAVCGYDLRASAHRCPECGDLVASGRTRPDPSVGIEPQAPPAVRQSPVENKL